jgi:hypothetical protein
VNFLGSFNQYILLEKQEIAQLLRILYTGQQGLPCGGSEPSSRAMRILGALTHFSYTRPVPNYLPGNESDMSIASAFADI